MPTPLWLRASLAALLLPGLVAGVLPWWLARSQALGMLPLGASRSLGAVPLVLGLALLLRTIVDFAAAGQGTLAPWDPPRRVVRSRAYQWVRNPMYLAVLAIILGQALLTQSMVLALYLLLVAIAFHLRVVLFEEPVLRRQFGDTYADYLRTVPRWIPRRPPLPER